METNRVVKRVNKDGRQKKNNFVVLKWGSLHGNQKGFALPLAILLAALLMISSTSVLMQMTQNKISLRKETEVARLLANKNMANRYALEIVGASATRDVQTALLNNEQDSVAASSQQHLASGSLIAENKTIKITEVDPKTNIPITSPQSATITEMMLSSSSNYTTLKAPDARFDFLVKESEFVGKHRAFKVDITSEIADNTSINGNGGKVILNEVSIIMRVIEIPSQLGLEGENYALIKDESATLPSAILGRNIHLQDNVDVTSQIVSALQDVLSGGVSNEATRISGNATAGSRKIKELDSAGSEWMVPVGTRDPALLYAKPTAPTLLEKYSLPYCLAQMEVNVSGGGPSSTATFLPTGDSNSAVLPEESHRGQEGGTLPIRAFPASPLSADETTTPTVSIVEMWDRSIGNFTTVTEVDINALREKYKALKGGEELSSVFVQSNYPVVLRNGQLVDYPFSIVTNMPIYIPTSFGVNGKPFSIFSPQVIYGRPGYEVDKVTYTGQRVVTSQAKDSINVPDATKAIDGMYAATNSPLTGNKKLYKYEQIAPKATKLPPIYLKNWFIFVDAETQVVSDSE